MKKALSRFGALLLIGALALLGACAELKPTSPEEGVAVTISAVTAARQTASTLLQAKKITPDDAANLQQQADNIRAAALIARSMIGVDPAGADAKLQQTRAALLALQAYLTTKEKR